MTTASLQEVRTVWGYQARIMDEHVIRICCGPTERDKAETLARKRNPAAWRLGDTCDEMIAMCDDALAFNPLGMP